LRNLEGGVLQGTSRALGEEITWDDRKVTSIDWHRLILTRRQMAGLCQQ
jgi:hypothetical protein